MGVRPKQDPMLVSSTFSMTPLRYTLGCATVSSAYVCKLYLQNHVVSLHLWVSNFKCRLCLLALPTESLGYTILIGVPPCVQPMFLRSTLKINGLEYI